MAMRITPLLLFAVCLPAVADTSGRTITVDPRKFTELYTYRPPRVTWQITGGGKYLLSKGPGNSIGVVDVATGKDLGLLKGHTGNLHDAGYSRDGRFLATAGYDGTSKVWDLQAMKEVASVNAHAGYS